MSIQTSDTLNPTSNYSFDRYHLVELSEEEKHAEATQKALIATTLGKEYLAAIEMVVPSYLGHEALVACSDMAKYLIEFLVTESSRQEMLHVLYGLALVLDDRVTTTTPIEPTEEHF